MDRQVREILEAMYERVRELIQTHQAALQALTEALIERETLDGVEAIAIMRAHGLVSPKRRSAGGGYLTAVAAVTEG
jgi:ATP-dependent Zn protease